MLFRPRPLTSSVLNAAPSASNRPSVRQNWDCDDGTLGCSGGLRRPSHAPPFAVSHPRRASREADGAVGRPIRVFHEQRTALLRRCQLLFWLHLTTQRPKQTADAIAKLEQHVMLSQCSPLIYSFSMKRRIVGASASRTNAASPPTTTIETASASSTMNEGQKNIAPE